MVSEPCEHITDAGTEELQDLVQVCGAQRSSYIGTTAVIPTASRTWKALAWTAARSPVGKVGLWKCCWVQGISGALPEALALALTLIWQRAGLRATRGLLQLWPHERTQALKLPSNRVSGIWGKYTCDLKWDYATHLKTTMPFFFGHLYHWISLHVEHFTFRSHVSQIYA